MNINNQHNGHHSNNLSGASSFPKRPRSRSPNRSAADRSFDDKDSISFDRPHHGGRGGGGPSLGLQPKPAGYDSRNSNNGKRYQGSGSNNRRDHYAPPKKDLYLGKRNASRVPTGLPSNGLNHNDNNGSFQGLSGARPFASSLQSRGDYEDEAEDEGDMWSEIIDVPSNQWLFTKEDLYEKTPARLLRPGRKPISYLEELTFRAKAVSRIIEFAAALKLARRTVIAASIFIHRYYMFNDFVSTDYKQVVATCVFIATKSEENLKSIKTIATHLAVMYKPGVPIEELEGPIWKFIDSIKTLENKILKDLRFDLLVEMPFDVFEEVFDRVQIPSNGTNVEANTQNNNSRRAKLNEKELYVKQFYHIPESIVYCPAYILYNHYEIAAASYLLTMISKKEKVPKGFIQEQFGVGLAKIADFIKYCQSCFEHLRKLDIKIRADPEILRLFSVLTLGDVVREVGGDESDIKQGRNEFVAQGVFPSSTASANEPSLGSSSTTAATRAYDAPKIMVSDQHNSKQGGAVVPSPMHRRSILQAPPNVPPPPPPLQAARNGRPVEPAVGYRRVANNSQGRDPDFDDLQY